jgi:hypothetical protein
MESLSGAETSSVTKIECCNGGVSKVFELNDSELVRLLDKLFAIAITKAVVESIRQEGLQRDLFRQTERKKAFSCGNH